MRADAQRNLETLLEAAKTVFGRSGVDAPMREIAAEAGVGVGTVYRHFPQRSDLIAAVFKREVDACAAAAAGLRAKYAPDDAVVRWLKRYCDFIGTKRGLAAALHSGDPAYDALPAYFQQHLSPTLDGLLKAASAAGTMRADISSDDLLRVVSNICVPDAEHTTRMLAFIVDGLRYRGSS